MPHATCYGWAVAESYNLLWGITMSDIPYDGEAAGRLRSTFLHWRTPGVWVAELISVAVPDGVRSCGKRDIDLVSGHVPT